MKMNIEDKIYRLGLMALDELLLHRNTSKYIDISLDDASILSDFIVLVGPHAIFAFDESEIKEFYNTMWVIEMDKME